MRRNRLTRTVGCVAAVVLMSVSVCRADPVVTQYTVHGADYEAYGGMNIPGMSVTATGSIFQVNYLSGYADVSGSSAGVLLMVDGAPYGSFAVLDEPLGSLDLTRYITLPEGEHTFEIQAGGMATLHNQYLDVASFQKVAGQSPITQYTVHGADYTVSGMTIPGMSVTATGSVFQINYLSGYATVSSHSSVGALLLVDGNPYGSYAVLDDPMGTLDLTRYITLPEGEHTFEILAGGNGTLQNQYLDVAVFQEVAGQSPITQYTVHGADYESYGGMNIPGMSVTATGSEFQISYLAGYVEVSGGSAGVMLMVDGVPYGSFAVLDDPMGTLDLTRYISLPEGEHTFEIQAGGMATLHNQYLDVVVFNDITPVPEPSAFALFCAGVMGFGVSTWRGRRKGRMNRCVGREGVLA